LEGLFSTSAREATIITADYPARLRATEGLTADEGKMTKHE